MTWWIGMIQVENMYTHILCMYVIVACGYSRNVLLGEETTKRSWKFALLHSVLFGERIFFSLRLSSLYILFKPNKQVLNC